MKQHFKKHIQDILNYDLTWSSNTNIKVLKLGHEF